MTTTITITGTFEGPDTTAPSGTVTFTPLASPPHFVNGTTIVPIAPLIVPLTTAGYGAGLAGLPASFSLIRCAAGYRVMEQVSGGQPASYVIPDQAGPVDLSTFH